VYVYIWSFEVNPLSEPEFERTYGREGAWVQLFRHAPGYLETDLLRDLETPGRYLTIDRWESRQAFERFHQRFRSEFERLDRLCESLTRREVLVGHFEAERTRDTTLIPPAEP
jgi:heme-degrading monooxygenase HmoA